MNLGTYNMYKKDMLSEKFFGGSFWAFFPHSFPYVLKMFAQSKKKYIRKGINSFSLNFYYPSISIIPICLIKVFLG